MDIGAGSYIKYVQCCGGTYPLALTGVETLHCLCARIAFILIMAHTQGQQKQQQHWQQDLSDVQRAITQGRPS